MFSLHGKNIQIIAEVKTQSPFGWKSHKSWEELFELAQEAGDIISIHTDERWGGSFDLVKQARSMTYKPILAKGIHATDDLIEKAILSGADWVLCVGRIPAVHVEKCLIEPNSLEELKLIPGDMKVVWNSRDLETGGFKTETFDQAREIFPGWMCQASNISTVRNIKRGADAVLVGSELEGFVESLKKYSITD